MVHDRFDHTSQLQLIGKRFGVPVPNLTPWRASVTGDMTSAFNFAAPPDPSPPNLDHPVRQLPKVAKCVPNVVLGFLNEGLPYRVPYPKQRQSRNPVPRGRFPAASASRGWFRRNGWLGRNPRQGRWTGSWQRN